MNQGKIRSIAAALFAAALLFSSSGWAQEPGYPRKPIRVVVPYAAGSPLDITARKITEAAAPKLGAPVVIDNKPGAGGVIGANEVARAAPDGYTLLLTVADPLIASTVLVKSVPYDPLRDFKFITKLGVTSTIIAINAKYNIRTLKDLAAYAKTNELSYGSFGPGSFIQIMLEEFNAAAGVKIKEVAYRSPPQAIQGMLGDEVAITLIPPAMANEFAGQGKAYGLATIGDRRTTVSPEIPTVLEQGYDRFVLRTPIWSGLLGPAGVPDPVVSTLQTAIRAVAQDPEMIAFYGRIGSRLVASSPAEFEAEFRQEYAVVVPLIKSMGITPQ